MAAGKQSIALRVVAVLLAVALGLAGAALLALGTCHDSGGFCAETFSATHVTLYAMGVALLSLATAALVSAVTRRRAVVAGIGGTAAVVLLVLIVVVETIG